jgi:hypothetical protein
MKSVNEGILTMLKTAAMREDDCDLREQAPLEELQLELVTEHSVSFFLTFEETKVSAIFTKKVTASLLQ